MKQLIMGLLVLFLLSITVACAKETAPPPPSTPTPEPVLAQIPSLPAEDAIIEMSTVGTMSGMA